MIDSRRTDAAPLVVMAAIAVMILVVGAGELHHHLSARPIALPLLLFELLEVVLLVGCGAGCVLLILRVRVALMAATSTAMLALLLLGEWWFAEAPVTLPVLLVEVLEVALFVGATMACTLLLRPAPGTYRRP